MTEKSPAETFVDIVCGIHEILTDMSRWIMVELPGPEFVINQMSAYRGSTEAYTVWLERHLDALNWKRVPVRFWADPQRTELLWTNPLHPENKK